jgi:hypothetical protein
VLDHLEIESKDRVLEIECGNGLGNIIASNKSFEWTDIKFLKSHIIDNFYGNIQKILVPSKEGNLFEEPVCFQMLQKPKWYHKLIVKIGGFSAL